MPLGVFSQFEQKVAVASFCYGKSNLREPVFSICPFFASLNALNTLFGPTGAYHSQLLIRLQFYLLTCGKRITLHLLLRRLLETGHNVTPL